MTPHTTPITQKPLAAALRSINTTPEQPPSFGLVPGLSELTQDQLAAVHEDIIQRLCSNDTATANKALDEWISGVCLVDLITTRIQYGAVEIEPHAEEMRQMIEERKRGQLAIDPARRARLWHAAEVMESVFALAPDDVATGCALELERLEQQAQSAAVGARIKRGRGVAV